MKENNSAEWENDIEDDIQEKYVIMTNCINIISIEVSINMIHRKI